MAKGRKKYSKQFKFQVVMELVSKQKTQAEILAEYWVHPSQQIKWKKDLMERWPELFEDKRFKQSQEKDHEKQIDKLYRQIGQLSVERDCLQKKIGIINDL